MFKPELVIFDMDGLMFDTERLAGECHNKAAKEFGYSLPMDLRLSLIGGNSQRNAKLIREVMGEDYPKEKIGALSMKYRFEYLEKNGLTIKDGLIELLEYLKEENIKIAVASSSNRDIIDYYLKLTHLENQFDYIMSGDHVVHSKPEPEIFLQVCEYFQIAPENTLVLEDSKNGILAAHNGHIPVICVPDMIFHDKEIFALTYATVSNLHKVKTLLMGLRPKLAVFDMDGLMFDTEALCIEPLIKAHQKYNYPMTREICDKLIGTSGVIAREIMEKEFGKDYPYDVIMPLANELLLEEIRKNGLPIKEGLIAFLEKLKSLSIPCVIASSSKVSLIEEYLEISNTRQYFEAVVGGDMVEKSKPEPDIFMKACDLFNVDYQDALVFEDSRNGIIASTRANIPSICVPDLKMHDQGILNQTVAFIPVLSIMNDFLK